MREIAGKRALVTGAASGIGRAIAFRLAREKTHLYLLDQNSDGLDETAHYTRQMGVEVVVEPCDLCSAQQISQQTARLLDRWGELHLLVNNAGVTIYESSLRMTGERWQRMLAVNLHAPIQLTHELLPTLLAQREAHILNVASMFGLVASRKLAAYCTTKFGLVGFSEALRAEYARHGLGVTALCPGFVDTNLFTAGGEGGKIPPAWLCTSPERVADAAVRAVYRNRRMVLLTPLARALYYAKRLAPGLLDVGWRLGRKVRHQPASPALAVGPAADGAHDRSWADSPTSRAA